MRRGQVLLLAILLTLFLAGGCAAKRSGAGGDAGEEALPVRTAKVKMGMLEAAEVVSGKLEAGQSANVVAKTPGKVAAVHVEVGSAVRAGQVLVTLDNTDLAARVEQARAVVMEVESAMASAEAAYAVAEANYRRNKQLFEQGAIPQAALEGEELKYLQAREQVERALPARLAQARASLALAESAYADSLIRAPISGLVTARNVNPGEMASTMAPVVSLVNIDKVEVKATVGESLVNQLKQGQKVRVIVRAVSGQPFSGTITSVAPAADPVTKGFPVKIEIDNPRHVLKPGMFAEVQVAGAQKEALLVPREAVTRDADKDVVWVVKDGRAQKREVKPGESDGRQIMIAAGLAEGEEVVVAGQEGLAEGARVKVINE